MMANKEKNNKTVEEILNEHSNSIDTHDKSISEINNTLSKIKKHCNSCSHRIQAIENKIKSEIYTYFQQQKIDFERFIESQKENFKEAINEQRTAFEIFIDEKKTEIDELFKKHFKGFWVRQILSVWIPIMITVYPSTFYTWDRYQKDKVESEKKQEKREDKRDSIIIHRMKIEGELIRKENENRFITHLLELEKNKKTKK